MVSNRCKVGSCRMRWRVAGPHGLGWGGGSGGADGGCWAASRGQLLSPQSASNCLICSPTWLRRKVLGCSEIGIAPNSLSPGVFTAFDPKNLPKLSAARNMREASLLKVNGIGYLQEGWQSPSLGKGFIIWKQMLVSMFKIYQPVKMCCRFSEVWRR